MSYRLKFRLDQNILPIKFISKHKIKGTDIFILLAVIIIILDESIQYSKNRYLIGLCIYCKFHKPFGRFTYYYINRYNAVYESSTFFFQ